MCGELLGVEPHLIVDLPDGEHVKCRDWTKHAFPYARVLRDLRRRYKAIREAVSPEVLVRVVGLGRWLAERQRMWPEGAAETVLESGQRFDAVLPALREAGVTIR